MASLVAKVATVKITTAAIFMLIMSSISMSMRGFALVLEKIIALT